MPSLFNCTYYYLFSNSSSYFCDNCTENHRKEKIDNLIKKFDWSFSLKENESYLLKKEYKKPKNKNLK